MLPCGLSPEIIDPEKAALLELQPEARGLFVSQSDRAHVRRHQVRTAEERIVGEPHQPDVRDTCLQPTDVRFRELRQTNQQVTLTPRIVSAPASPVRLAPHTGVE